MNEREIKLSALRIALDQQPKVKGSEVIFFCPRHRANSTRTEGQLSVNLETDRFNCWSCGFGGSSIYRLLILRGKTKYSQEYLTRLQEKKHSGCTFVHTEEKVYDTPVLPDEFRSLSVPSASPIYRQALTYLAQRGITADDILRWKLGYAESGEMHGRIIIPSFDASGILNYVVGRSFTDDPYRYKPYPRYQTKNVVWNECMVDWSEPVTLLEGPFDAFIAEDNVTILQGTFLADKLVAKLVLNCPEVYFALDADAFKRQLKHIRTLLSYGVKCRYIDVKSVAKDVGAMGKEKFRIQKANARFIRNELDIAKMRLSV